jgi:hypothetical protein
MSTKKHDVPEELLSGLLANYKKPEDLIGEKPMLAWGALFCICGAGRFHVAALPR